MASIENNKWLITGHDDKVIIEYKLTKDQVVFTTFPAAWDLKDLLEKFLSIPERSN